MKQKISVWQQQTEQRLAKSLFFKCLQIQASVLFNPVPDKLEDFTNHI